MSKFIEAPIVLTLNWLIPGAGFIVKGKIAHGIILFILLNLTFIIGLLLYGAVTAPIMDRTNENFNWVNILTFISHLGNGGMSLLSLADIKFDWNLLPFDKAPIEKRGYHPWADLASMYFLVSGAMNYFSTCNLYDRFYKTSKMEQK